MLGQTVALRGLVMWNRTEAEPLHLAGMGIRLSQPTSVYRSFVAGLA
jgi:hypothetical protein